MRIVVATDGHPRARGTFSGSSARMVAGLEATGAWVGAVDVKPRWLARVEQAASYDRDRDRWHQRFWSGASPAGPAVRRAMSALGRTQVERMPEVDAVLQISGWYDARPARSSALLASYQDANGMLWTQRPDLALDPQSPGLRRAREAERRTYARMDVICTMSEWSRSSFIADYGVSPDRVVAVGAGPNLDELPPVARREPGPPRVIFVGRTFGRKGGPELLEAFRTLHAHDPRATLDVVGPPPGPAQPGVTWHGPVYDRPALNALYARATIFALPSRYEGFGIPFLEGMAHGLPCVGARVCAVPEVVREGRTGLLVAPGDARALGSALLELAADPARAAAMGRAGRAAVEDHWTWEATGERIVAALSARSASAAPPRTPTTPAIA
jgi:glycosyltransferase involved in cell wall biosynthesis